MCIALQMTQTLLHFGKSVNRLNKYVNLDLKNLTYWLNANKSSLNLEKPELVVLKHQRKKLNNFNWKQHIYDIAIKLNRANALLSTGRNYVNKHILRTIYIAIFDSCINYANHI